MNANERNQSIHALLQRAALASLLARGYAYPDPGHAQAMHRALAHIRIDDGDPNAAVAQHLQQTAQHWASVPDETLREIYGRLFLGGARVSLHETAYGDGRRIAGRPVELADINGFYVAFGVGPSETCPDLPDHIGAELEFYSLLLIKQAYALSRGWGSKYRIAQRAAQSFLESHLGRWIGALADNLDRQDNASPYRETAGLARAFITAECARMDVQPQATDGQRPPDEMQDDDFTCPYASGPVSEA